MQKPKEKPTKSTKTRPPATTPEAKEAQMISLAMDLAEKQLLDGSASSQTINHFLALASSKDILQKEIMKEQKKLISAKTEAIESSKRIEELYINAMKAMQAYKGADDVDD